MRPSIHNFASDLTSATRWICAPAAADLEGCPSRSGAGLQARHIATATRQLTAGQATIVDHRIAPVLGAVSFGRLHTLLEAAIMQLIRMVPNNGPPWPLRNAASGWAAGRSMG
jgi:hypothetical protein